MLGRLVRKLLLYKWPRTQFLLWAMHNRRVKRTLEKMLGFRPNTMIL